MKKIKSYKGIMNDEFAIRVKSNESYKNITKDELNEIIEDVKKINFNRS